MKFETDAIHAGQTPEANTGSVIPPIYATSTFAQTAPGETRGYDYTRSGNPNFTNLETALAALEGTRYATAFGSGMAAISAIVSSLAAGDLVLAEENVYGCTYRLFDKVFGKFGVRVAYVDFSDPATYAEIEKQSPKLVWIESPTNPLLKVLDIAAIAKVCKISGAQLVVDNTFASPYNQRPVELGADLSVSSTTKYVNGHSDCLGGVVCTDDDDWYQRMVFQQKAVGLNPSPFDAWLISRGLKTLPLRMERHQSNALALAKFLEARPETSVVRYPFLDSHPQVQVARRQMRGGSGIVTAVFDLDLDQTKGLVSGFKLFALAESLGGVESLACHPASMTHASIPRKEREKVGITDGLIRFSVGIEHVDDLIADVEHALKRVAGA